MTIGTLITHNGLELPCVIFPTKRALFPQGTEVMVYCQNRLVKGYVNPNMEDIVSETEVIVDYCSIPEYDQVLCTE